MNVSGIGVVFAGGRGIGAFEEALRRGWSPPGRKEISASPGETMPVYSVEEETIKDKAVLRGMRRADRFNKMAVLAAFDAVIDSGIAVDETGTGLGIILATGVCAMVMRFVTVAVPPDLAEEEEERLAAERKAAEKEKDVFPDNRPAGGVRP